MTNLQIYINDQLIDLRPGTVIAKTIQAFDLFAFGTARANYTNQITAPKTSNNRKVLQFVDNIKSASTYAYQLLPVRIIQNGIELIGNGFAQIVSTDTSYNITFFDGNYGFFTQIANKKLWDIDLSALNQAWTSTDKDAARANATGLVSAVINFGKLVASGVNIDATDLKALLPSLYYSSLIDKLFKTFGFSYSGNVFTDAKFLKMVMPLTSAYSPPFAAAKEFNASAPGTQVMANPVAATKVTFNNVALSGKDNFYNGVDTWTVAFAASAVQYFFANFSTVINITVATGTVDIVLHTALITVSLIGVGTGTYTLENLNFGKLHGEYFANGDTAYVTIQTKTGTPNVTINSATFQNKVPVLATGDSMLPFNPLWAWPYLIVQHLLPDMLITDFMKDFATRFGLLFKESKGSITTRNIDELINDTANAVDWTTKRDKTVQEKISYQFSNFSQVNKLKWANQADSSNSEDFAMGSFAVPNPNLSPEQTITSPFSSSTTRSTLGLSMAQIPIFDSVAGKWIAAVGARLLFVRSPYAGEPAVQFSGAFRSDYQVAYFLDGKQPFQMTYSQFISDAMTQFSIRMQNAKMVLRSYNLNDADINSFDQLKLIFDDGVYFIVNKIINYIPGKLTSVELFKV